MSDTTLNYISGLYTDSSNIDVQQTLEYNFVKAFPSINSTNNGQIYSEPNVRWLTKQFTKKPFVIPHDGNPDEDMFKFEGIGLNGTYTSGGLANIDGYIVSIAKNINDVYFDNDKDTEFGSKDGIIYTQIIQRTLKAITDGLETADLYDYISGLTAGTTTPAEVEANAEAEYNSWLTDGISKDIGDVEVIYQDTDNLQIIEYIDNLPDEYKTDPTDPEIGKFYKVPDGSSYYYKADYNVYLGIPDANYKVTNTKIPFIYVIDGFGLVYTFYNSDNINSNRIIQTHCYPSTRDNRINMQTIRENIDSNSNEIINATIPNGEVYDTTVCYDTGNTRVNPLSTKVTLNNIYNKYDTVTANDVLKSYCLQAGTTLTSLTSIPDCSDALADSTYCLKATDDSVLLKRFIKEVSRTYNSNIIPISVFNSSGKLCALNLDFDNNNTTITTMEGYVTFMRRLVALFVNWSTAGFNSDYITDPNGDNVTSETASAFRTEWNKLFKFFEINGATNTTFITNIITNVFNNSDTAMYTFFGVTNYSSYADIKFHHIYNTIIAPAINTYLQIGWTGAYSQTVLNNMYTPSKALTALRDEGKAIYDDEYYRGDLSLTHSYTTDAGTINDTFKYTSYADLYTDNDRLDTFLCQKDIQTLIKNVDNEPIVTYRLKADNIGFADCEDFVSYLKRCSVNARSIVNNNDNVNNLVSIPYVVTSLSDDSIVNIPIDDYRYYETSNNSDYPTNTPSWPISELTNGYIQNVTIDTNTMLPKIYDTNTLFFWYYNGSAFELEVGNRPTYNLSIDTFITTAYYRNEGMFAGLDGISFFGYTQNWITSIPIVFRLYKNSQNFLMGRKIAQTVSDGIVVDYKFPIDIKETDLWFANAWLRTARSVGSYNLEDNGAEYPGNTDGMETYLNTRNSTIFDVTKIYGQDENGKYLSFDEYVTKLVEHAEGSVEQEIEEAKTELNTTINNTNIDIRNEFNWKYEDFSDMLISNAKPNTIYRATNFISAQHSGTDFAIDAPELTFEFDDKPKANIIKVQTYVVNNTTIQIGQLPANSDKTTWYSNCAIDAVYNNTNHTWNITLKTNTSKVKKVKALLTFTFTPPTPNGNENLIQIEFIDGDNILTNPEISYLFRDVYALDTITWEKVHQLTAAGLASKIWHLGDTKQFIITASDNTVYDFNAFIAGFNCNPNIDTPHIVWMTKLNRTASVDTATCLAIGMTENGTDAGFTVNQGMTGSTANNQNTFAGTTITDWLYNLTQFSDTTTATFKLASDISEATQKSILAPYKVISSSVNGVTATNYLVYGSEPNCKYKPYEITQTNNDNLTYLYQPSLKELNIANKVTTMTQDEQYVATARITNPNEVPLPYFEEEMTNETDFIPLQVITRDCYAMYNENADLDNIPESSYLNEYTGEERQLISAVRYQNPTTLDNELKPIGPLTIVSDYGNKLTTEFCFITK